MRPIQTFWSNLFGKRTQLLDIVLFNEVNQEVACASIDDLKDLFKRFLTSSPWVRSVEVSMFDVWFEVAQEKDVGVLATREPLRRADIGVRHGHEDIHGVQMMWSKLLGSLIAQIETKLCFRDRAAAWIWQLADMICARATGLDDELVGEVVLFDMV